MMILALVCLLLECQTLTQIDPVVYRPNLVKRLQDLEKKLKISAEERSRCSGELREAPFINLKAIRMQPLAFDAHGRPINDKENTPELHKYMLVIKKGNNAAEV
jgi:predicted KAP-like P-loop ATPase